MAALGGHTAARVSPPGASYLLVGLAAAGLVFAGFGMYISVAERSAPDEGGAAARAVLSTPVAVESSPVLTASGVARVDEGHQLLDVDASGGTLVPGHISVESGYPVELRFSRGEGYAALVVLRDLGVSVDLSGGPASIRLPALKPGTYPITGANGVAVGLIVAR